MVKNVFIGIFVVALIGVTVFLIYRRNQAAGQVSLNPSPSESISPSVQPGDAAMTDVKKIMNSTSPLPAGGSSAPVRKLADGLEIQDTKVGTGPEAVAGKNVAVHYTGWLTDGTKFDSSLDRGQPFQFVIGKGMVIRGWDEGVAGMKVGGTRRLVIPSTLGYGAQGTPGGPIPPNATLVFEIQLLGVQ